MRPLARQDFVNFWGISSVNFEDRLFTTYKMGKKASLVRQLAGLPASAPRGLL